MILLDTHVLLWLLENPARLSPAAKSAIAEVETAGRRPIISGQSLYEIARGVLRGRIQSSLPPGELLAFIERRFVVSPLTSQIALAAAQLPSSFPSDPFDRIIAATALVADAPLVTADRNIRRSRALRTIW
ncbi:MAG: type II toxin-antitoxin system VapC family toxin [Acidobacteriaceae bacterium]